MRHLYARGLCIMLIWWGLLSPAAAQTKPAPADSLRAISRDVATRLGQRPSDQVRVVQVRELLLEQVQHGPVRELPRLLAYLRQTTADTTVGVRPYEEWALLAAAGDWYSVAEQVRRFSQIGTSPRQQLRYQRLPQDGLFDRTVRRVAQRQDTLRAQIRQARFLPEDSTFLQLFVTLLVPPPAGPAGSPGRQSAARNDIQAFLTQYPATEYGSFLRQFVGPEYAPSRFSYGLDFHSGSGLLLGELPTYFRHGANMGVGFEAGWDQYQLYLRDYIGLGSVRRPFDYGGPWRQGLKVNYFVPEISLGYRVVDNKRLRLVPFLGLSALLVGPANTNRDDPDNALDLSFRRPLTAGLNLDVLLWPTTSYGLGGYETGSWLLKLRAGVRQAALRRHDGPEGGIIYLDLGIGGFGRMMKRK
ncbi:hypothetical protein [Hymenobacter persicinus]|uniref:PorT family protein n=1 Tax=Hymenobacter persicinus TaxID=2025506 RepID=A0A4Q5L9M8_9BACT|nr:hypothetical protein [Hymenobacter persicinus]RYU78464.1 hypothetical protein EWM57_13745 [Hymenobacter persicinus]